ncbi:hypothetical protein Ddye_031677 [Dipteronia dyeriana]|uniref:Protein TIFY n=1 Tax=Dipteronia dyeriana TaxID=168575 RepID=A0AAD9WNZ1_9ROSI|nr:hypothetical protein Ddye_031677 [Dipteronia dyeriana]
MKMSRANVELDFFGMERKENSSSNQSQFKKLFNRQRSFRDIQGAISKINPEILKSVIASGSVSTDNGNFVDYKKSSASASAFSLPSTPKEEAVPLPSLPLFRHITRLATENLSETAPLTIFYNGTVTVFDVPREKAETILKLALEGNSNSVETNQQLLETLNNGDLPIARRKSLQRFLEKRKERLTTVSPYSCCD